LRRRTPDIKDGGTLQVRIYIANLEALTALKPVLLTRSKAKNLEKAANDTLKILFSS
jgi:hypothetical protein